MSPKVAALPIHRTSRRTFSATSITSPASRISPSRTITRSAAHRGKASLATMATNAAMRARRSATGSRIFPTVET